MVSKSHQNFRNFCAGICLCDDNFNEYTKPKFLQSRLSTSFYNFIVDKYICPDLVQLVLIVKIRKRGETTAH